MREHTYPGSYESHLRRRVKELERENERLKHRVNRMLTAGMGKDWGDGFEDTGAHEATHPTP